MMIFDFAVSRLFAHCFLLSGDCKLMPLQEVLQ